MRKHLLILLALVAALSLVFVACDKTPDEPADTTASSDAPTEEPTDAPTEPESEDVTEPATEEGTTAAPETQEPETQEPETQEPETQEPETQEPETQEPETQEPETQAPETEEPVDIDLTTVTATGSWPTVDVPVNAPALGLGEDQHVIALHYGSIVLGEMDLSKFSKVTVTYTTPAGELNGSNFNNEYDATGKRVLLLNTLSAVQEGTAFEYLPAEDAIITTNHYDIAPTMGTVMTVEIDLTEIDYNGQVILSFDARNANNEFGAIGYLVYVIGITFA